MTAQPVIAIVGAPNAGKSTLFNRFLGRRRALVHRQPGMTRDVNEAACDWEGRPVRLVDTGGLIAPGDASLEGEVRAAVLGVAAEAAVLVFVVDGRSGLTPLDEDLARLFRQTGRPLVLAVNKLDRPGREEPAMEFHSLGFDTVIAISAEHGLGIDELRVAVSRHLPERREEEPVPPGEIRVAIAGRPNVGKSSLLNRLLGRKRTIVSEVPGTTRDSIDCLLESDGRRYRIIDTAGIRRRGKVQELPETLSVMAARRNIEGADVVLLLMDVGEAPAVQDLHVAGIAKEAGRPFIAVINKWDLLEDRAGRGPEIREKVRGRLKFAPFAPILTVSAITGAGVGKILPLVAEVHEQAGRRFSTGKLNSWLQSCVKAHHPPVVRGKPFNFYYMTQKGSHPPSFVLFTSSPSPPHFSYQRYLENSLRSHLGLTLTPVVLVYRQKPRRQRRSIAPRKKPRKRSV